MNAAERLTIARILKVNHAGEFGAIRIYRAQIWIARRLYPDICAFLEETLGHEINHCSLFRHAMPQRGARPCRVMAFWGNGGWVLGFLTGLLAAKVSGFALPRSRQRFIDIYKINCIFCARETLNSIRLFLRFKPKN